MTENEALESALKKIIAQEKSNWGYIEDFDVDENWAVRTATEYVKQYRKIATVKEWGAFGEPEEKDIDRLTSMHHKILDTKFAEIVTEQEMIAFLRAKDAVRKQIRKPVKNPYGTSYIWKAGYCPVCGCGVTARWDYCQCCGQRLNWEDA